MSSAPSKAPGSSASSSTNSASSTSSAPASADPIQNASKKAFHSSALYLQSELEASGNDLSLLEKLNDAAISKYEGVSRQTQDMLVHGYKIKQTYKEMEMQLAEIDDLVASIDSLEQMAQELDAYSLQLETRFKNLLK
ncbi:biogenesis of lysosome- organelles complex 1 subunit 2 [Linderina pennispora]|nr:biogenesis of lysosome- organelles complex 1 subunit 2 [Linderina pennispora]